MFVNMALVGIVLLIAFSAICLSSYRQDRQQLMSYLERFTDIPGQFSQAMRPEIGLPEGDRKMNADAMYLVYTVLTDPDGTVEEIIHQDVEIAEDSLTKAITYAIASISGQSNDPAPEKTGQPACTGTISSQRLAYSIQKTPEHYVISFTDYSPVLSSLRSLILTLALAGLGILVAFFFISLFLARWMIRPVETAWEQQRQFIADASHELKTPLTVILANTGIVLGHRDETIRAQEKWITYIKEEAERMKKLVEDMLFLAKSDAARLPSVLSEVNLSDLTWSCLLPFESIAFEQHLKLNSEVAPGVLIHGDGGQLKELITILLDNACKYCAPSDGVPGVITVILEKSDRPRLTIHNTGSFIPEDKRRRLFERFYRVDESRDRNAGGYGLGLSIAKSICDLHHAKISVKSSKADGTSFSITF